jgi:hypothetical protein
MVPPFLEEKKVPSLTNTKKMPKIFWKIAKIFAIVG